MMKLTIPAIDDNELNAVKEVLDSGYLTMGPKTEAFERAVAEYTGAKYAIATTSATTALHLSLVALDIGKGDEVIVPSFTFPATVNVIIQQEATPVLADIDLETFNISAESLKEKVTSKTKAIMPVHLFGLSADMDPVMGIASENKLMIIEDAACALGSLYKGKHCGAIGTIGCFSFHPRKIITTGEGGMVITNNPEIAERARRLKQHGGMRTNNRFSFIEPGFNYRMSDINAAIGISQMKKIDWIIEKRREMARRLTEGLSDIKEIILPSEPSWAYHTYQTYAIILNDRLDRDLFIQRLQHQGIEAVIGTYALHMERYIQGMFGYTDDDLPNSKKAFRQSVAIPLYPQMKGEEADRLVRIVKETVAGLQ
jgi:dTDP-4-amino-4,6-dideoxygalactose transaminase